MSKVEDSWPVEAEEMDSDAADPVADAAEESGLEVTDWNGYPNYHCPDCSFAHLDPREVYEHARRRHA